MSSWEAMMPGTALAVQNKFHQAEQTLTSIRNADRAHDTQIHNSEVLSKNKEGLDYTETTAHVSGDVVRTSTEVINAYK